MKKLLGILLPLFFATTLAAQAPHIQSNQYWPTAGSGLTLNLSPGYANCAGTVATYAGGTLTMTASTTNYIYLNTASSCIPAAKTTAFTAADIPLATVVAGGSAITGITDVRTPNQWPAPATGNGISCAPAGSCTVADATKLPVTGGTMTGSIGFSGTGTASTTLANLGGLPLSGGTLSGALNGTSASFSGNQTSPGFYLQSGAAGPHTQIFDDFYNLLAVGNTGPIGSASGNSTSTYVPYEDANHPGNILLTSGTGGSGTGEFALYSGSSGSQQIIQLNGTLDWTWETAVYVPVLPGTTAGSYQAGAVHLQNVNPWTTGAGFYLSRANGVANDWYCQYGTTYTNSSTLAVASTWTRLTMKNDGTTAHWYINGTEVCGTGTTIASLPSTTQYAGAWAVTALSGTSVTMAVDYLLFQCDTVR